MASLKEMLTRAGSAVRDLPVWQKALGAAALTLLVSLLLFTVFRSAGVDYKVLFSGLSQEDAAAVVEQLKTDRIPYKISAGGSAILVPAVKVYETRLRLAGAGLPRGGGVGFEIFDKNSYSTTDFVQRLNYQRALQGELARTIRQFSQVVEARVHIATPRESVFIEDKKPVTASISVRLRGRSGLSKSEIQSIVNLVASAVPGLTPDHITLVDTAGHLLYRGGGDDEVVMTATQLEYQQNLEKTMTRKIESMLEEVVGVGRVRARVTADIDFNRVRVTEESFDPDGQVLRSEQVNRESEPASAANPQGIPGVKGELATAAETGKGASQAGYSKESATRNYEISRTTRQVQEAFGRIRRLSVAVMVDGTYREGKDGKREYVPRSAEELRWFDSLVKKAVGYNEERGDQVEVLSMAFAASAAADQGIDKMAVWRDWAERLIMPVVYLLLGFGIMLFVIRPFFRYLAERPALAPAGALPEGAAAEGMLPGGEGGEEEEEIGFAPKGLTDKERIFRLAQSDPDRAADLVRRWLREEEA